VWPFRSPLFLAAVLAAAFQPLLARTERLLKGRRKLAGALITLLVFGAIVAAGLPLLLAASAVMAETIPPCINLIILGFVANLSIGGLFVAGLLPSALMALVLIAVGGAYGTLSEIALALKGGKRVVGLGTWAIEGVELAESPDQAVDMALS
jgi:hypothetical protein